MILVTHYNKADNDNNKRGMHCSKIRWETFQSLHISFASNLFENLRKSVLLSSSFSCCSTQHLPQWVMWMDWVSWVSWPSLLPCRQICSSHSDGSNTESPAVCRGKEQDDVKGWWWVSSWTWKIVSPGACGAQQSGESAARPRQSVLDRALFWIRKDLTYASNSLVSTRCSSTLHCDRRQGPAVCCWGCVSVSLQVCLCV